MTVAATRALRKTTAWDPTIFQRHSLYWPIAKLAAPLQARPSFPTVAEIDEALGPYANIRFRVQRIPSRRGRHKYAEPPYDEAIAAGQVPTREGSWHDLMNALVWAAFPRTKRVLHDLQKDLIAEEKRLGLQGRRLPKHDMLALLDEGGVLLFTSRPIPSSPNSAVEVMPANGDIAIVLGHAVFEAIAINGPWPLVRALVLPTIEHDGTQATILAAADRAVSSALVGPSLPANPKGLYRIDLANVAAGAASTS